MPAVDRAALLRAATVRVQQFLAELDHVGVDDVALVSLPAADTVARGPARTAAAVAADDAGLGPFLTRTREAARVRVIRMYDRKMYQPTWGGLNWGRSLGTVEDRIAVAAAVEDAAIATRRRISRLDRWLPVTGTALPPAPG